MKPLGRSQSGLFFARVWDDLGQVVMKIDDCKGFALPPSIVLFKRRCMLGRPMLFKRRCTLGRPMLFKRRCMLSRGQPGRSAMGPRSLQKSARETPRSPVPPGKISARPN